MKTNPAKKALRVLAGIAVFALIVGAGVLPASAERVSKRTPPEVAVGGLTIAEQVAHQRILHDELASRVPSGVDNAPIWVDITQADRDDLAFQAPNGTAPLRIGVVKPVLGAVGKAAGQGFERGVVRRDPDGSFVWGLKIISPGAQAIRVHLTEFSLPSDTEMFFLGASGQADGPYSGLGRNGNGDFWTRSIPSDTGVVLLRYTGDAPDAHQPRMSFVVSEVAHIRGRPPMPQEQNHDSWPCSDNAPCVVDAQCGNAGPAEPAKDAIAKMEWIKGAFVNTCTGGLIADTDGSTQIPYFLTANHCLTSDNSNLETFFNYTTTSCNGDCPDSLVTGGTPPPASTVGVTAVATGRSGDYTLLTLNQTPPAGAVFLGWNNTPIANSSGASLYRISNPNFGPQAYSEHEVDTNTPECRGWPRGERIYSMDVVGATMGGSSGSPVVNSAGEVVGQLSGCCGYNCADECDSANNWTVDGALAYYWDSVAAFLDPQGGGGCSTSTDCDDNQFCNGAETCSGGTCQAGSDPCPGQGCDEANDVCVSCAGNKETCSTNGDCCSNNCKNGTCKGN